MNNDTLRGSRLGSSSLESDTGIDYSTRKSIEYVCPSCDTVTCLVFAADAEAPVQWDCSRCNNLATLRGATLPDTSEAKPIKEAKTPFEMLLERRSRDELEEILNDRLAFLRQRRGAELEDLAG